MAGQRISLLFVPDSGGAPKVFRFRPLFLYALAVFLMGSVVISGVATYFLYNTFQENRSLKSDNSALLKDRAELEKLTATLERIKKDESLIRSFLGLESSREAPTTMGQGGPNPAGLESDIRPNADLISQGISSGIAVDTALLRGNASRKAEDLEKSFKTILEAIGKTRKNWDHTPSIVPLASDIYWVTSEFGKRIGPLTGVKEFHNGIDITGRPRSPVISPAAGRVTRIGRDYCLGKYLEITHQKGLSTMYGHLRKIKVRRGQKIKRGQVIAVMGRSGRTTGTHLHYTVKVNKKAVNPRSYMLNMRESRSLLAASER